MLSCEGSGVNSQLSINSPFTIAYSLNKLNSKRRSNINSTVNVDSAA